MFSWSSLFPLLHEFIWMFTQKFYAVFRRSCRSSGIGICGICSSGRGIFEGLPRLRLIIKIFPFMNNWPPHTPHGSSLSIAPFRHGDITGHVAQSDFAWLISWISSEKNIFLTFLGIPAQLANACHSSRGCSKFINVIVISFHWFVSKKKKAAGFIRRPCESLI